MAIFYGILGLVALYAALTLLLRKFGGYAPGWQVRCTKCGFTAPAASAGIIRIGAFSVGKRTLGYCSTCQKMRVLAIEREPAHANGSATKGA